MTEMSVVLAGSHGLHARPASQVVQTARQFSSKLRLACGGKEADARSVVGLMGLGAKVGDTITIRAEGSDEAAAAGALAALLEAFA